MTLHRSKVSGKVESRIMFDSDHTCCICREKGKDVQIHHIDGNSTNNDPSNLTVLCLDCHSKVTGSRGLGRMYSELEVKKYKKDWEFRVRKKRGMIFEPIRTMKKVELASLEYDIRKNVYEFAATKNMSRSKEILEFLDLLHIFEGNDKYILGQFHLIVPFVSGSRKGSLLAEYIPHFFWHLPGPDESKIDKKDIKNINKAIDVLTWLGEFDAEFIKNADVVNSVLGSLYDISETANSYHLKRLTNKIIRCIKSIQRKAITTYNESDKKLTQCAEKAEYYIKKIEVSLKRNQLMTGNKAAMR